MKFSSDRACWLLASKGKYVILVCEYECERLNND